MTDRPQPGDMRLPHSENGLIIAPMAVTRSGPATGKAPASVTATHDHGFHRVAVTRVVAETADAASIVLDVPAELTDAFAYEAGQFCTFRVEIEGVTLLRCYSMSSAPTVDDELQVTVKRVPGGAVSNWLLDHVEAGAELEVTVPAGVFLLGADERELVAFAAGSGITPVFSLLKTVLHETDRAVRLLYANRDRHSVIFGAQLDALAAAFPDRLEIVHHFDVDRGFVDTDEVRAFLGDAACPDVGHYLCGPAPFMDVVEVALLDSGAASDQIHIERFTPAEPDDESAPVVSAPDGAPVRVTIELDGHREAADHRAGTTILQTARQLGLSPPFSCESGSCATCMARVIEGTVEMHVNNALADDELAEGWILTCQAVPTSPEVSVRYGFEGA
jgi:3-ketosteroid 9alpha-monooxygenase subunit B